MAHPAEKGDTSAFELGTFADFADATNFAVGSVKERHGKITASASKIGAAVLKNRLTRVSPFGLLIYREAAAQARIENKLGRQMTQSEKFQLGFVTAAFSEMGQGIV